MNMNNLYENMYIIPKKSMKNFIPKKHLSFLECVGLESILVTFLMQYEEENFGINESNRENEIRGYTRYCEDSVSILDGVYDTYEFNGFLFDKIWTTENGCIMISAYKIPENHIDDWQDCDFISDFEEFYIRLDW